MCQGEGIPRGAVLSDETERGDGRRVSGGGIRGAAFRMETNKQKKSNIPQPRLPRKTELSSKLLPLKP